MQPLIPNKDIYKSDRTTKPEAYMALGPGFTRWNIFTAVDKDFHYTRRQLIGQVISERLMRVFEQIMTVQIDLFIRNLLRECQRFNPFDISTTARQLGLDIAGILVFGYNMQLQIDKKNHFMLMVLDSGILASNFGL